MGKLLVTVFAFAPAPMTNLKWPLHPDTRICTQLKSCTLTIFCLRDNFVSRHCASAHLLNFCTGSNSRPLSKPVPRPRQHAIKLVPRRQKHVPYPPCTVTISQLKNRDVARCCRRVTQPPHIAGPL
jgi:hypothetical protein